MMGFGSSGIETTSSWSLWKTTREFIEKARRAAVVDGKVAEIGKPRPRSANPSRDPTINHHTKIEIDANPSPFPTITKGNRAESREGNEEIYGEQRGE
uniref:Uncharacterized protein n=1 Tax=Fagus sylvatica TaxID=28930 RepID=A0A2N9HSP8_FAGSY